MRFNGEELSCDQCSLMVIQGVPCHETGCPNIGKQICEVCELPFKAYHDEDGFEPSTCRSCYYSGQELDSTLDYAD